MRMTRKWTIVVLALFATSLILEETGARPSGNGKSDWFTALAPSATGKPGTGEYTLRNLVDDGRKNNLAFINEVCPPLARVVDQVCQTVQNIVERCIGFFFNGRGGGAGKGSDGDGKKDGSGSDDSPTGATPTDDSSSSSEDDNTPEETTMGGANYDTSGPKFGGDSDPSSSTKSSSENSTDKSGDKEGAETTTPKQ